MKAQRDGWTMALLPESIILDTGVSPSAFRLYALLSLRQGQGMRPNLTTMAAALATNTRVVKRWLKELATFGYLAKESAGGRKIRYILTARPTVAEEDRPEPIPLTAQHSSMLAALAHACSIDTKTAGRATMGRLNQTARVLREAGAVPEDMVIFSDWWSTEDWRGKRGSPPVPAQVRAEWGRAMAWWEQQEASSPDLPEY